MANAYREDLAYIHDVGFGHLAKNAAQVLLNALRHSSDIDQGTVIDLGCGSGLLARELAAADYGVMGIDLSEVRPAGWTGSGSGSSSSRQPS